MIKNIKKEVGNKINSKIKNKIIVKTKEKKPAESLKPEKENVLSQQNKELVSQKKSKLLGKTIEKLDNNEVDKTKKKNIILKKSKRGERAGTGISGFDTMVEKGFERESINLIAGGSGSGKSIFALQFLMEGVKKGEKVLYITFEEKKDEFYENMKKFGWDLAKAENSGKFIFLEYSPEKVKMMLDEGGGTIESIVFKNNIERMVIDSITSFSLLFDDELSKRQANLGLFSIIRNWNCTTLLTVQYDPLDKRDKEISSIEFEVDSITLLYFVSIKNKRERFIEVLKMRGTNHSKEIHLFEISRGGIKVGKKAESREMS